MENKRFISASLGIIIVFIVGIILRLTKPIVFPFLLALFLSYILSPLLDFLKAHKIPKTLSIIFIVLAAFFIIYLLGSLFYSSGKTFAEALPQYGEKANAFLNTIINQIRLIQRDWKLVDWIQSFDFERMGKILLSSLGPFFSFFSNLFLIFVFLLFILAERDSFQDKLQTAMSGEDSSRVIKIYKNINHQIQRYLAIKTTIAFSNGLLAAIILTLFDVEFAVVFGFLTFLLDYVPSVGAIISTFFPVAMAAFQFETLWPAFWILIILISIQTILSNFIEPRLMGSGLGLSPLAVLISLLFWGWLWGVPGMILAVPITGIIKIICSNIPSLKFVAVIMSKAGQEESV